MTDNIYTALQGIVAFVIGWSLAEVFRSYMNNRSKKYRYLEERDRW